MKLKFERVNDVADDYCHLDVFREGSQTAFMDVSVHEDGRPRFNIYGQHVPVSLTLEEWKDISEIALKFTKEEIINEEAFRKDYPK